MLVQLTLQTSLEDLVVEAVLVTVMELRVQEEAVLEEEELY